MACNEDGIEIRFTDHTGYALPNDTYIADVTNNALVVEYENPYCMEVENHGELKLEISLDNTTWHSVGVVKPMEDNVLVELSKNQSILITDDVQEQISSKLTPGVMKII